MSRCRHAGEPLRQARRLRAAGQLAAALDVYLDILAAHPTGHRCRGTIAIEAAQLGYTLDCLYLTNCLAGAAFDEATRPRDAAEAWTLLAMVDARARRHERAGKYLQEALAAARRHRRTRRALQFAKLAADILAQPAPARPPTPADRGVTEAAFDTQAPRGGGRVERALARVGYASAVRAAGRHAEARANYAAAAAELSRERAVRSLRRPRTASLRDYRDVVVGVGWATAVAGQVLAGADYVPDDAMAAASLLAASGLTYQATQLDLRLAQAARRAGDEIDAALALERIAAHQSAHLCWYLDDELVADWAETLSQVPLMRGPGVVGDDAPPADDVQHGWLTSTASVGLIARLSDVYGRLYRLDAENFAYTDVVAVRTLGMHIDKIGLPWLALIAARTEVAMVRAVLDTPDGISWVDLAWALRRHATHLDKAGLLDDQVPLLTEAADLYREHIDEDGSHDALGHIYHRLVDVHLLRGAWTDAALAAVAGAGGPETAEAALGRLEREARIRDRHDVADEYAVERKEILRLLAVQEPATHASRYLARLAADIDIDLDRGGTGVGPVSEATSFARQLVAADPHTYAPLLAGAFTGCAAALVRHGCAADALLLLDDAVTHWRASVEAGVAAPVRLADALDMRATCLAALNRGEEHVACLLEEFAVRQAAWDSTDPTEPVLAIADALWEAGQLDATIGVLTRTIDDAPRHGADMIRLRLCRARCLPTLCRGPEALDDLRVIAGQRGESALLHVLRGRAYWTMEQWSNAITELNESLAMQPEQHEAREIRGVLHLLLGHTSLALSDLLAAARVGPGHWTTRAALADTYLVLGNAEAALREGHLAVDLAPDEATARCSYGVALLANGHTEEALAQLDQALALIADRPNDGWKAEGLLGAAHCHVARGDAAAAVRTVRAAIAHNPTRYLVWETVTNLRSLARVLPATAKASEAAVSVLTGR